jgi:Tol biopolymer transport system component
VFDVASRTTSVWSVQGDYPAWSPDGSQIAFVAQFGGGLSLIKPDGTGLRALNPGHAYASSQLGWTPDSRYVIARNTFSLTEFVDPAGTIGVPLPWSSSFLTGGIR